MVNFERNDNLNDFRNYFTHSYSINRLLIFPIQFLRAQTSPPPLLKKRVSYAILLHSFLSIFPVLSTKLLQSMAFVFQREHNSYGTCSALSPFDFNSASFFTLRLSVYSSYRDRVEGGTRRASAPPPLLLKKTCRAKDAPILPPA